MWAEETYPQATSFQSLNFFITGKILVRVFPQSLPVALADITNRSQHSFLFKQDSASDSLQSSIPAATASQLVLTEERSPIVLLNLLQAPHFRGRKGLVLAHL